MTAYSYFAKNVPQYIHREKNTALIGLKGICLMGLKGICRIRFPRGIKPKITTVVSASESQN